MELAPLRSVPESDCRGEAVPSSASGLCFRAVGTLATTGGYAGNQPAIGLAAMFHRFGNDGAVRQPYLSFGERYGPRRI